MKVPSTGEIELCAGNHPAGGPHTPLGIIEIIRAHDRHGCRHLARALIDAAVDQGVFKAVIIESITDLPQPKAALKNAMVAARSRDGNST
ncbi:MAG: hypothetical protein MO852_02550 [Candidatus Devosia euplotis]|nr:hypothetical protein [Candidatus Devosia euplotis]